MPELLLDKKRCLQNMERMAEKAREHSLGFRPHFKTHQSAEIGNWFRDFGVSKITVSSFRMAAYFSQAGWKDILVAFPFDPSQIKVLNTLAEKSRLSILIDSPEILPLLKTLDGRVAFYIDIDTGYGRTGVPSEDTATLEIIFRESRQNKHLLFSGFYCHAGHSYKTADPVRQEIIHEKARSDLSRLKEQFGIYKPLVLYGDTPNCSTRETFTGMDELTPGNFVFYDLTQVSLGACTREDIAVAMRCPVVSKYPGQRRLLIHGGAVHFSKESLQVNGTAIFGRLVDQTTKTWTASPHEQYIHSISQEHGILEKCDAWMDEIRPGDKLTFLPVHSCLTANLMRQYQTTEGQRITTMNGDW
jgi:D-serine deaminase-like pyridoxal phosphate-dependent protein